MWGGDRSVADMFPYDGAVLAFDQGIVGGLVGPRLSELHQQFLQQLGHDAIDKLRAVIAVEAE